MSVTVRIGSSRFQDCRSIISYMDRPMLQLEADPIRATVRMPPERGIPPTIAIEENRFVSPPVAPESQGLRLKSDLNSLALTLNDVPLLMATLVDRETIVARIDFRPVGINIFDDAEGLHIGANILRGKHFSHSASAIDLG
jgi:hypothetical protein